MLQSANARQADQILQLQAEGMQTQAVAGDNARLQKEIAQLRKVGTEHQTLTSAVYYSSSATICELAPLTDA